MSEQNLEQLYYKLSDAIEKLDLDAIWKDFKPLKFALYNDKECFFDGHYIEKTADFCANTAIEFEGEYVAIWNVSEEMDFHVFVSKIVHEMFHAFQETQDWGCFTREMEALYKYQYSAENLSIKLHENELLLELLDEFDEAKYKELMDCRKYRSERFPYEFTYETQVEEIEGTANYVEWKVLEQLDKDKAKKLIEDMQGCMTKPEYFFPIRISSYYTGVLMIKAMSDAGQYTYSKRVSPRVCELLDEMDNVEELPFTDQQGFEAVEKALLLFQSESKEIVEKSVDNKEVVLTGPLDMVSVNIYDARFYQGYITSRFFLMYRENGENKAIHDNYVIKMKDEKTIETVYKWA